MERFATVPSYPHNNISSNVAFKFEDCFVGVNNQKLVQQSAHEVQGYGINFLRLK